jgi:hypothetical protein
MPQLTVRATAASAALLLALAACGRTAPANNGADAPPPETPRVDNMSTMSPAPAQSMGHVGAEPDEGDGPRNRFIVCPGNPRCPPEGSEPQGGR